MFGELIVAYLFLGGAGAGAVMVASLLDLLAVRVPCGPQRSGELTGADRLVVFSLLVGLLALLFGLLCLMCDLGRPERILAFLTSPRPTLITFGAYALGLLVVLVAVLCAALLLRAPCLARPVVSALEVVACVVALGVMAYTGLFLRSMSGIASWDTPLVPVLFVLSAASCGVAIVLGITPFARGGGAEPFPARITLTLVRADVALIACEIVVAGLYVAFAQAGDGASMANATGATGEGRLALPSVAGLLDGEMNLAGIWWLGFVLCGLVVPIVVELAAGWRGGNLVSAGIVPVVVAALVLVGAYSMRSVVVGLGEHRPATLEAPTDATGADNARR